MESDDHPSWWETVGKKKCWKNIKKFLLLNHIDNNTGNVLHCEKKVMSIWGNWTKDYLDKVKFWLSTDWATQADREREIQNHWSYVYWGILFKWVRSFQIASSIKKRGKIMNIFAFVSTCVFYSWWLWIHSKTSPGRAL